MVYTCVLESGPDGTRRKFKSIRDARRYAYNRAKRGNETRIVEESKRSASMGGPVPYRTSYIGPLGTVYPGRDGRIYWVIEETKGVPHDTKEMKKWEVRVRIYPLNPDGSIGKAVYDTMESRSRLYESGLRL